MTVSNLPWGVREGDVAPVELCAECHRQPRLAGYEFCRACAIDHQAEDLTDNIETKTNE